VYTHFGAVHFWGAGNYVITSGTRAFSTGVANRIPSRLSNESRLVPAELQFVYD